MTENSVVISITIRVSERELKIENEIGIGEMEESIQGIMLEARQQALGMGIKVIDDRIAEKIPRGWQNALANTLLQFVTPTGLRGRVMGVYTMTFQAMFRLGGLQAGFTADWLGAPITIGIGAGASLIYGLFVAFRYPKLRQL